MLSPWGWLSQVHTSVLLKHSRRSASARSCACYHYNYLRSAITIVSAVTKQMVMVELTVPTEDQIEVAGQMKRLKYQKIVNEGNQKRWSVKCWSVKVGCRGFSAISMSSVLKDLVYIGWQRKQIVEKLCRIAEYASRSLWKASHYREWGMKNKCQLG